MTALTIEKLTKNCSGIKDIKNCHGSTKFSNFQLPQFVRHRKKAKDLNQVQRYWRTLARDTPSCDLISVFFACNRVLTSDSVKSLIKLDHLILYDICLTARLLALKNFTTTPSEIDTCLVHFEPYAYFTARVTMHFSMKL